MEEALEGEVRITTEDKVAAAGTKEAVAVATTEEAVAVLIPTAPATTQEPEVADLLSLIRSTHQTSPTSPE